MFKLIPLQIMLVVHVVKFVSIKMLLLSKITTHKVRWHNLSKLQLTISDGTTYPKLQLTMADSTTYPKLQFKMAVGTTYPKLQFTMADGTTYPKLQLTMSDGTAYPKLQLTMSDGTTYPNYNSQCQIRHNLSKIITHNVRWHGLSKITTHNVRWHNLSKLQPTMSDGTTYSNYSPQCHDQMAKVIQMRLSE